MLSLCLAAAAGCSSAPGALFSTSGVLNAEQPAGGGSAGADIASSGAAGGTSNHGGASNMAHGGGGGSGSAESAMGGGEIDAAGSPAGGAPAAGASGSAGSGVVNPPSACDGKLVVPASLIDDFEDGVAGWSGYIADDPLLPESVQPGADMTEHALRFKGGKASTSGVFHLMPCSDVSDFDGVQFWAKGKGGDQVRFLAVIPATDPTPGVGDCDPNAGKCSDHPGKLFTFGADWQLYSASFAELKQYGWGIKASFDSVINAVLWINDGPVDDFDFAIDEVSLYKAATPQ